MVPSYVCCVLKCGVLDPKIKEDVALSKLANHLN